MEAAQLGERAVAGWATRGNPPPYFTARCPMKFKFRSQSSLAPNSPEPIEGGGNSTPPEPVTNAEGSNLTPPEPSEDLSGLKSALQKERDRANQTDKQLKQIQEMFKGIDPEKYKQLQVLQAQAEEWNQKEAQMRQTLDQEWAGKLQAEQKKTQEAEQRYQNLLLRTQAEKAYQVTGGRSGGGDDNVTFFEAFFKNVDRSLKLNDKGELEVIDGNGVRLFSKKDATKPMSAAEYFSGLLTHPVLGHYFAPQQPGKGGGMQPNTPVNMSQDFSTLPRSERLTLLRQQQAANGRK